MSRHAPRLRPCQPAVADRLERLPKDKRLAALCELNVVHQVLNVAQSTVMQDAWSRGQEVSVHGWIYGVHDGVLQDLLITLSEGSKAIATYQSAVDAIFEAK